MPRSRRPRDVPARKTAAADRVDLVLYISPSSRYSSLARRNCEQLLAQFDPGKVSLEVCDVSAHPERADEDAICYTPVLVKRHPLPRMYLLGDLSNSTPLVHLLEECGVSLVR